MLHPKILKCVDSCVTIDQANSCLNFIKVIKNEFDKQTLRNLVDARIKTIQKNNQNLTKTK